jgi:hypothetical protein
MLHGHFGPYCLHHAPPVGTVPPSLRERAAGRGQQGPKAQARPQHYGHKRNGISGYIPRSDDYSVRTVIIYGTGSVICL